MLKNEQFRRLCGYDVSDGVEGDRGMRSTWVGDKLSNSGCKIHPTFDPDFVVFDVEYLGKTNQ